MGAVPATSLSCTLYHSSDATYNMKYATLCNKSAGSASAALPFLGKPMLYAPLLGSCIHVSPPFCALNTILEVPENTCTVSHSYLCWRFLSQLPLLASNYA
jgi:hypothetical protein